MTVSDESKSAHFEPDQDAQLSEFTITRIFEAPRDLLFSAWTEQQHLKQWFGPKGFTIPLCRLNLVPGGTFHYCIRAANGSEMWGKWTFREIVSPKRLVLVNSFSNKHGNLTRHPYIADWPMEMLTTAIFLEDDGQTGLKLTWSPINASPAEIRTFDTMHDAMTQGWNGTFDQLAEYLTRL